MKRYFLIGLLILLPVLVFGKVFERDYTFNENLSDVKYGVGAWLEDGFGNHRAVLSVQDSAPVVSAHIKWRRYDNNPETKALFVCNEKGDKVPSKVININSMDGDIVFEAKEKGNYYVYYMPYESSKEYNIFTSDYFPATEGDLNFSGDTESLPKATLTEIQSRIEGSAYITDPRDYSAKDFYSMYPMLITCSGEEKAQFESKITAPFGVFCEDRTSPIKMLHEIPYTWFKTGEKASFEGTAQPGEIYTFQIGVYGKENINDLQVVSSDFNSNNIVIKAEDVHCINTGGIDYLGNKFTKKIDINKGDVQPLWFYMTVPEDFKGELKGQITIKGNDFSKDVPITINVDGEVLTDGGVSESWRMSRISWLDSTIGEEDTLITPYIPVTVKGNKISILNRTIELSPIGFPNKIIANNINVLASPMDFVININNKPEKFTLVSKKEIQKKNTVYECEFISKSNNFQLRVKPKIEFDGCVAYSVKLDALKDGNVSDVVLNVPYNKSVAKYIMGLGLRGGFVPDSHEWHWNTNSCDYMAWIGDYNAGLQVKAETSDHGYYTYGSFPEEVLPQGWYNDNKGGITLNAGKNYDFKLFGGDKNFAKGDSCNYDFRLMVTPFKNGEDTRYDYRMADWNMNEDSHQNYKLVFHGQKGNEFINYPFVTNDFLKNTVQINKNKENKENFSLIINENKVGTEKGSATVWVESNLDWSSPYAQKSFINFETDANEEFNLYYGDSKTLRFCSYSFVPGAKYTKAVFTNIKDTNIQPQSWRKGDKHVITITWGDKVNVYCDGTEVMNLDSIVTTKHQKINKVFLLSDMVNIKAVRMDGDINLDTEVREGENTVLFEDFSQGFSKDNPYIKTGQRCNVSGNFDLINGYLCPKDFGKKDFDVHIYYTARELSNHCQEIWALKSLGDEVLDKRGLTYTFEGAEELKNSGGGYQWLTEQMKENYIPAWHMKLANGEHCASVATKYECRWLNFYVQGMDYLMKNVGVRGLYLDGIGYNREITKRLSRVMASNYKDYRLCYHSGNNYEYLDWHANVLNDTIEHLPYMTSLWIGEMFDYNNPPEYWFAEITGMPFGVPSEELCNSGSNTNPYRGMIYGMDERISETTYAMWRFWDDWDIMSSEMIGYWHKSPVATCDNPNVKVTVYKKKDKALVAVASWGNNEETVNVKIDKKKLGMNDWTVTTPAISGFQDYNEYENLNNIVIAPGKGYIFELKAK